MVEAEIVEEDCTDSLVVCLASGIHGNDDDR